MDHTTDDGQEPGIGAAGPAPVRGAGHAGGQRAWWWVTTRAEGDTSDAGGRAGNLAAPPAGLSAPRWTWLDQVHGTDVVTVAVPGEASGARADGAVTAVVGAPLAVRTADCAPVVLAAPGAVGLAHAGWRGLAAGVVGAVAAAMAALGEPARAAVVGPCISAAHYEFSADDLAPLARRFGQRAEGRTGAGRPALDLRAAVRAALAEVGVTEVADAGGCTAAEAGRWFSHRARREAQRMTTVAWLAD